MDGQSLSISKITPAFTKEQYRKAHNDCASRLLSDGEAMHTFARITELMFPEVVGGTQAETIKFEIEDEYGGILKVEYEASSVFRKLREKIEEAALKTTIAEVQNLASEGNISYSEAEDALFGLMGELGVRAEVASEMFINRELKPKLAAAMFDFIDEAVLYACVKCFGGWLSSAKELSINKRYEQERKERTGVVLPPGRKKGQRSKSDARRNRNLRTVRSGIREIWEKRQANPGTSTKVITRADVTRSAALCAAGGDAFKMIRNAVGDRPWGEFVAEIINSGELKRNI